MNSPPPLIGRALISVSDKSGITDFARALAANGIELISTGGTANTLQAGGLVVKEVADVTGFPEMMEGRVKTLHPAIHGGLLAKRDNQAHISGLEAHNITPIDLLVVNLYPFEQTVAAGRDYDSCVEQIDIGGPAMIRAAAKNHAFVGVVTDPRDYASILKEVEQHRGLGFPLRQRLAAKAYAHMSAYDAAIAAWFKQSMAGDITAQPTSSPASKPNAPPQINLTGTLAQSLRYGENPHQQAGFYRQDGKAGPGTLAAARLVQGKVLSYNNINDADAAFELVAELERDRHHVAIIKHANPCGVAGHTTQLSAYHTARSCDPVSAFGGIIAFNQCLEAETAEELIRTFNEVIIAPAAEEAAIEIMKSKPDLRLLLTETLPDPYRAGYDIKPVSGGFLWQSRDNLRINADEFRVVTDRAPDADELRDLIFAFTVAKHVKSNAIIYARNGATLGIGAGQMSRIDSTRIAIRKSQDAFRPGQTDASEDENSDVASRRAASPLYQSVVASDAFFPFADGLIAAAGAGATAVIQPGGSRRDEEVIAAANKAGIAMIFTNCRHFRH